MTIHPDDLKRRQSRIDAALEEIAARKRQGLEQGVATRERLEEMYDVMVRLRPVPPPNKVN
jgi:hypothetical protein